MSSTPSPPPSPAELRSTPVDGVDVLGALSPSRASDFMTCPLLYRYRTIDRLAEEPSPDALRGTLIHKVLEDLFDLPAATRTPDQARDLLVPTWDTLLAVFNAAGQLTTYGSTLDDGTGTSFHFDVDASQPWQRYVDRTDAAGHVLDRTVLVDNGQSWEAIYTYAGGQVVSYEVDSFDVNGQLVGKGFFHADGTPI